MPNVNRGGAAPAVLHVLFVATSGGEGGIERYSIRLAVLLRARGIQVTYACRADGFLAAQCAARGIPTVPWEVRNSGDVSAAFALTRVLRGLKCDIVHVHSRRDYVPAIIGARLSRHPRVVLHAHLVRALGEPPLIAGRFFRWGADRVIAVSQAVRDRLLREHRFRPEFVSLIPNGVDVPAFVSADGAAQRAAWGVPPDAPVVGMMGRLNAKGQERLLAAAPALLAAVPGAWFVLVGPEGETGDRERLLSQADEAGIGPRVILPGMTEDVPSAMAAFDVLVHLPEDESFGLAPAEAMAAGRPVIATDIGGCREVLADGVTGTLVALGDERALLSALRSLFEGQEAPARREQRGTAGRLRVRQAFSVDTQVDHLVCLYRDILTPRAARLRTQQQKSAASLRTAARTASAVAMLTLGISLALYAYHRNVHTRITHTPRHVSLPLALRADPHVSRG